MTYQPDNEVMDGSGAHFERDDQPKGVTNQLDAVIQLAADAGLMEAAGWLAAEVSIRREEGR